MNIFAGGLPYNLSETELRDFFEVYGVVSSVKLITDKLTGKGKGFGFIEMPNEEEAKNAIEDLNGAEVDGKPIVVNKSIEKKDDNKRSNFNSANKKSDFGKGGYNKGGSYNKGGYNKGGAGGASKGGSKKGSSRRASY
jgi:RNA recognition motif-containing protein